MSLESMDLDALPLYPYSRIDGDRIRLLQITKVDDDVECHLTTYRIGDVPKPKFLALSYAWGTQSRSARVRVGQWALAVTPHLLEGLRALNCHFPSQFFWIDVICMNQNDDVEKAEQVPLMRSIYFNAKKVVVWLGPAVDDSELLMRRLPWLSEKLKAIDMDTFRSLPTHLLSAHGFPEINDPLWLSLFLLYSREWFTRLWVMQEAASLRTIRVLCGSHVVDWELLHECADKLFGSRLEHRMENLISFNCDTDGFIIEIERMRRLMLGKEYMEYVEIVTLLGDGMRKQSSEPVDKVYGLLGLMDPEMRKNIVVDYSATSRMDFWKLYVAVSTMWLLNNRCGLALLELCPRYEGSPELPIWAQGYERFAPCAELPSWCPDFRFIPTVYSMNDTHTAGLLKSDNVDGNIAPIATTESSSRLCLRGLVMDRVRDVVPLPVSSFEHVETTPGAAARVLQAEARCRALSKEVYPDANGIPFEHMITLVRGGDHNGDLYPLDQIAADFTNAMSRFRMLSESEISHAPFRNQAIEASVTRYENALRRAWFGTSFITTEKGRIGIAPVAVKPGDPICIFFTASVPHALRYDREKDEYELIGQTYVYGLMNGEAFRAEDPVKNHQSFVVR